MRIATRMSCGVVGAWVLLAGMAFAQDTATLTGTIRDSTGAVIAGAGVALKNVTAGTTRTQVTNSAG